MDYPYSMTLARTPPIATLCGKEFRISAFGCPWVLMREHDLEEIWAAMGEADFKDDRIPYWTELWPASLVLAEWLERQKDDLKGKICLELGCGLGFTAIIGQWLGACVIACDYELDSLKTAAANASRNGVQQPVWLCMDWRAPTLAPRSADIVWGADILYEKRACEPILDLIALALKPQAKAWIADPGRGVFQHFSALAREKNFRLEKVFSHDARATRPQEAAIPVSIWELRKNV